VCGVDKQKESSIMCVRENSLGNLKACEKCVGLFQNIKKIKKADCGDENSTSRASR
jgi:hypothetical protein